MLSAVEERFGSGKALEACERELRKMLRDHGVLFGDGLLPTYAHAFLAPRGRVERWASRASRLVDAAEHAANLLVSEQGFFDAMGLDQTALELVHVNPGYRRICVLCRPDGIPVGDDMKFVEINSDSPAMMMFIDLVAQCLLQLDAFSWLRDHERPPPAADRLLDTLLACYREFGGTRSPNIAITDWEGQKTRYEHRKLAEHFEARGFPTVVCDPRAFRKIDGELRVDDRRIDVVYRRALASEIIERRDELGPLLEAYRNGDICMVNPLRSYVAGVKSVLSYLARHGGEDLVPRTILLDNAEARELVRSSPSRWVLKKSESHGGQNVILPERANQAAWDAALGSAARETWIAQEYLQVPRLQLLVAEGDELTRVEKHYNWNPFIFNGSYAGGLVRVSSTPLINITLGGGLLPTFCT